jgi:hypothetical protein
MLSMKREDVFLNYVVDFNGCWRWASGCFSDGYGQIFMYDKHWSDGKNKKAHRVFYEHYVGPIPKGLVLDHLCRVKDCVNPAHLEPVTDRTNVIRGVSPPANNAKMKTCSRGHKLGVENMHEYAIRIGKRICKTCHVENNKRNQLKRLAMLRSGEVIKYEKIHDNNVGEWTAFKHPRF